MSPDSMLVCRCSAPLGHERCMDLLHRSHEARIALRVGGRVWIVPAEFSVRPDHTLVVRPVLDVGADLDGSEATLAIDDVGGGWTVQVFGRLRSSGGTQHLTPTVILGRTAFGELSADPAAGWFAGVPAS